MTPPPAASWARPLALGLLAAALAACFGDRERRAEADHVLHLVDALVAADPSAKGPGLAALEAASCTEPRICKAREDCLLAFRPVVRGARLRQEVRAEVRSWDGGDSAPLEAKLRQAEDDNLEAARHVDSCLSSSVVLRQVYRL